MTVTEIVSTLVLRQVHVRQYLGQRRYEVWADGAQVKSCRSPMDAEVAVRKLLGITSEEGIAVERELARIAGLS